MIIVIEEKIILKSLEPIAYSYLHRLIFLTRTKVTLKIYRQADNRFFADKRDSQEFQVWDKQLK
jgi:hypothetical protein